MRHVDSHALWIAGALGLALLAPSGCATPSAGSRQESGQLVVHGLSDQDAQFGNTFLPLAAEFGLTRYAYAARTATGVQYEYLPEGETLEAWKHIGTLTLLRVGRSWDEGNAVLPRYVDAFRRGARSVHEASEFAGSAGAVAFTHYEIGSGPLEEHNLAATWQLLPGTLATFQVQQRGRVSKRQVEHFKAVAQRLAKASEVSR